MKVLINDLTTVALERVVASCQGVPASAEGAIDTIALIGQEGISLTDQHGCRGMERWMASLYLPNDNGIVIMWGPTPTTAVYRCYVASQMGDELIDVPDELVTGVVDSNRATPRP